MAAEMELVALPVVCRVVVDDAIPDGVGDLTGIRIDAVDELAVRGGDGVFVGGARLHTGDRDIPVAVAAVLLGQGMSGRRPLVEVADDGDGARVRRPHAEGDATVIRHGAHAGRDRSGGIGRVERRRVGGGRGHDEVLICYLGSAREQWGP